MTLEERKDAIGAMRAYEYQREGRAFPAAWGGEGA